MTKSTKVNHRIQALEGHGDVAVWCGHGWIHIWSCDSGSVMARVQEKSEHTDLIITWLLIISGGFDTLSVSKLWCNMNVLTDQLSGLDVRDRQSTVGVHCL